MVWACRKNGRAPYGQKGVDDGSKYEGDLGKAGWILRKWPWVTEE